jgi:hypothetical protein
MREEYLRICAFVLFPKTGHAAREYAQCLDSISFGSERSASANKWKRQNKSPCSSRFVSLVRIGLPWPLNFQFS